MPFTDIERKILNILYNASRPLTTTQMTKKTGTSWATTNKNLEQLHKRKYVVTKKIGNKKYWKIRIDYTF
ncbi:MAG: helix-turn-helix transcriptional regulator [Candidatus Aenigmarchaeota archaeon]|nr:helix-turn-helix transcriptional regulator [Candidatus Aenigmarchaeota archaeon]